MKIQIDEHWSVEPDAASWNLHYEKEGEVNPKTGNPTQTHEVSYHARLVDALHKYLDEAPKDSERLTDVMAEWSNATNRIEAACKGITKRKVGNEWQIG